MQLKRSKSLTDRSDNSKLKQELEALKTEKRKILRKLDSHTETYPITAS